MSFFGQLLAGAVGGAAGGYIKDREDEEKLAEKLQLRQLQYDQARMMQDDRQAFSREMALDRASRASGGKSTGPDISNGDYNYRAAFHQALQSGKPEEMENVLKVLGLDTGPEGQAYARQVLTGKAPDRQPTSEDVMASMATDGKEYTPQPPSGGTMGQREMALGVQQLQRAFARGIGKAKDQSEAEAQELSNDIYTDVFGRTLREGGSQIQAGRNAAMATNPVDFDKNQTNADRVAATVENTDLKRELAQLKSASDAALKGQKSANEIEDLIFKNRKLIKEMGDKDGSLAATVTRLQGRLSAISTPTPEPKATISNDGKVATGKIGNVQSVIDKYRQQQAR